ncbi:hypothetical protein PQQ87_08630 [Paraburkholderia nemoris]|uniref:hypothetical protein n=1 Tax=Paraburkholderia nemoris TaxID=2793076 RepID=UPI0038B8D5A4
MSEAKADDGKKAAKPKKRLTPRQWAEAEALWAAGDITLSGLCEKYGLQKAAFVRHFQKAGIKKGDKAGDIRAAAEDAVNKAAKEEAALLAQRIRETKEEHYKMAAGLAKLTWAEIIKAKQENTPFGAIINNVKSLELAMNALKKAREERYACLGLDRDDYVDEEALPDLVIQELTPEQIEHLRERDALMAMEMGLDVDVVRPDKSIVNSQTDDEDEHAEDDEIVEEG